MKEIKDILMLMAFIALLWMLVDPIKAINYFGEMLHAMRLALGA